MNELQFPLVVSDPTMKRPSQPPTFPAKRRKSSSLPECINSEDDSWMDDFFLFDIEYCEISSLFSPEGQQQTLDNIARNKDDCCKNSNRTDTTQGVRPRAVSLADDLTAGLPVLPDPTVVSPVRDHRESAEQRVPPHEEQLLPSKDSRSFTFSDLEHSKKPT